MKQIINLISASVSVLVNATTGKPLQSVVIVFIFHIAYDLISSKVEVLLFGQSYSHWFDLVMAVAFISYACFAVWACSEYQRNERINKARRSHRVQ